MTGDVLVLLSGGIDSSTVIAFYLEQGFGVRTLFCNYGQASANREDRAASEVAGYYKVPLLKCRVTDFAPTVGEIRGRNAVLGFLGFMVASPSPSIIALGIHAGTPYPDCGDVFVKRMNGVMSVYQDGATKYAAPFCEWSKATIWRFAKDRHVPLHLTYSCEAGEAPCGKCPSCIDRKALETS